MCTQVLDHPIRLLHIDNDVIVVNKPSSIPVHSVGRFRVSVIGDYKDTCFILEDQVYLMLTH